jgi:hypothetical protein
MAASALGLQPGEDPSAIAFSPGLPALIQMADFVHFFQ